MTSCHRHSPIPTFVLATGTGIGAAALCFCNQPRAISTIIRGGTKGLYQLWLVIDIKPWWNNHKTSWFVYVNDN